MIFPLSIKVKTVPSSSYEDIIGAAIDLADKMNTLVEFKFNGINHLVEPDSDHETECEKLWAKISKKYGYKRHNRWQFKKG